MSKPLLRKSKIGGAIGREIDAVWAAIRAQKPVSVPGQRITRTPKGTAIRPAASATTATANSSAPVWL